MVEWWPAVVDSGRQAVSLGWCSYSSPSLAGRRLSLAGPESQSPSLLEKNESGASRRWRNRLVNYEVNSVAAILLATASAATESCQCS